jgi:hypothetical protein
MPRPLGVLAPARLESFSRAVMASFFTGRGRRDSIMHPRTVALALAVFALFCGATTPASRDCVSGRHFQRSILAGFKVEPKTPFAVARLRGGSAGHDLPLAGIGHSPEADAFVLPSSPQQVGGESKNLQLRNGTGSDPDPFDGNQPLPGPQIADTGRYENQRAMTDDELSDEALATGAVFMGCNRWGQLGCIPQGSADSWSSPRAAQAMEGRCVKLLAFGSQHAVAVVREGQGERVISFGANCSGQLGRPNNAEAKNCNGWGPVDLRGAMERREWRQVSCGAAHTALLDTHGVLMLFGSNSNGQLGLGARLDSADKINLTDIYTPVCWQQARRFAAPLERRCGAVAQVACGAEHTVLLLASGEVLSFGQNLCGQLGRSFESLWSVREDTPLRVPVPSAERVVQIACGDEHTVMLLDNGTALAFGSNAAGQLGVGRHPLQSNEFELFQYAVSSQAVQTAHDELIELAHAEARPAELGATTRSNETAYMRADGTCK